MKIEVIYVLYGNISLDELHKIFKIALIPIQVVQYKTCKFGALKFLEHQKYFGKIPP